MKEESAICLCGKPLAREASGRPGERHECRCPCGRIYDLEFHESGWTLASDAITPEARQPLAGFSSELRMIDDCQRYYFFHTISGRRLPVHILFSPSAKQAEVKMGDMKALRIAPVQSVVEARSRWIERFDSLRGRAVGRLRHASRRGIFPAL
jgi:hypothetical protein